MFGPLSFTSPLLLGALVVLPLIWLILRSTPPSPRRTSFPAFVILREVQQKEETPQRTPWWLTVLRLLIAALIITGLAGPILNAPAPTETPRAKLVVIDNSWHAAPNWRDFERAMAEIIAEARSDGKPVYLLATAASEARQVEGPLTIAELSERARGLVPTALDPDYVASSNLLSETISGAGPNSEFASGADIRWLTDGLEHPGADDFLTQLKGLGTVRVFASRGDSPPMLAPAILQTRTGPVDGTSRLTAPAARAVNVVRAKAAGTREVELTAFGRSGRPLTSAKTTLDPGVREARVVFDLPPALRNEVFQVKINGTSSAGAVRLADSRERQATIGILGARETDGDDLLSGPYYIQQALSPFASFFEGDLDDLIQADVSVVILDDVGRLRPDDVETLTSWIEGGGVLIRFAGPSLADAAQDIKPALLPVPLRGGGRAFGGALSWETPQPLGGFAPDGPFAELNVPEDVLIKRQVLALPGAETSNATWAQLEDGTPLVTGQPLGLGTLALVHVTATPDWSDLPLSGIFVDMLRKLVFLAERAPSTSNDQTSARVFPYRLLDGYGALRPPADDARGIDLAALASSSVESDDTNNDTTDATAEDVILPGLYGAPEAPFAVNVIKSGETLQPIALEGVTIEPFSSTPPQRFGPGLLAVALGLFLVDAIAALFLAGKLRPSTTPKPTTPKPTTPKPGTKRATASVVAMTLCTLVLTVMSTPSFAQSTPAEPLGAEISSKTVDATLTTRLAFIRSGDARTDRVTELGLTALSDELNRRTSFEPITPVAVDPEIDDLSVYPILYWPIVADTPVPSSNALANLENFLRFGGLIIIDTRDDERAAIGLQTPERQALQNILRNIDTPPLTPLEPGHVLSRSFYLVDDLFGRTNSTEIWVEAGRETNDRVTSMIIGGRDWVGAWARQAGSRGLNQPLMPMSRGGERLRELSYRAGINIVMVALTGNYKSDQVHTPILLKRLGR
ncbi:MAG: DUF4159 domain-containing protein [Pseudomonadota bacterium]